MQTIRCQKSDMDKLIDLLLGGGIIAFPTDTVFGLACKMDEEAMAKVYAAKGRDFGKPLPMMCASLKMIKEVAYVDEAAQKIIEHFMPGALTIVFRKRETVPSYVTQGLDTIGIRVPDDDFILELISRLNTPLMVTSANVSGSGSLLSYKDVLRQMDGIIDAIVCEDARGQQASTIVDVSAGLKLLREGPIPFGAIEEVIR